MLAWDTLPYKQIHWVGLSKQMSFKLGLKWVHWVSKTNNRRDTYIHSCMHVHHTIYNIQIYIHTYMHTCNVSCHDFALRKRWTSMVVRRRLSVTGFVLISLWFGQLLSTRLALRAWNLSDAIEQRNRRWTRNTFAPPQLPSQVSTHAWHWNVCANECAHWCVHLRVRRDVWMYLSIYYEVNDR